MRKVIGALLLLAAIPSMAAAPAEEVRQAEIAFAKAFADRDLAAMTLPDARLVTVPAAAHQMWSDDPATVFAAIRQFLRKDWPGGAERVTKLDPNS